jgi:hypothetical protein
MATDGTIAWLSAVIPVWSLPLGVVCVPAVRARVGNATVCNKINAWAYSPHNQMQQPRPSIGACCSPLRHSAGYVLQTILVTRSYFIYAGTLTRARSSLPSRDYREYSASVGSPMTSTVLITRASASSVSIISMKIPSPSGLVRPRSHAELHRHCIPRSE